MNKTQAILNHLQSGNTITNAGAYSLCNCTRLGGHIKHLRNRGFKINTTLVPTEDGMAKYAIYSMPVEIGK